MVQNEIYFESYDEARLFLYRWSPDQEPAAVVNIVHGMAEHAFRYRHLAEKLTAAGIEVWAADQRGHGKTADPGVNKPGRGGLLGHCADGNGFIKVTGDVHALNTEIRKIHGDLPLFLFGHSWGSFIVQNYIEEYSGESKLSGCVLSGTRGPGGFKMAAGIPAMSLLAALNGQRRGSLISKALADGSYNKPFEPNRTPFDWLSRDEEEVDKYVNDPYCGKLCSSGFYRDMIQGLYRIHRKAAMDKINRLLPLYLFSGSADPVGDMGTSPVALINAYRRLGINDIEFVLYPGARHETLNETNRQEVMDNLLSWIKKHIEPDTNAVT
ncbi:MAG: lysophospholipase [Treponema sp.]|nr:lysophospholipase [Treponema sp.]